MAGGRDEIKQRNGISKFRERNFVFFNVLKNRIKEGIQENTKMKKRL